MEATMAWDEQARNIETIAGDRRSGRRYNLQLELRWKLIRRRRVLDAGTGHTIDLSSSGILFETGRRMPPGLDVELSISWPVLLHNVAPLQLLVHGRIVRAEDGRAAIRMVQHEFKTVGIPAGHRAVLATANRNPSVFLPGARGVSGLGKVQ